MTYETQCRYETTSWRRCKCGAKIITLTEMAAGVCVECSKVNPNRCQDCTAELDSAVNTICSGCLEDRAWLEAPLTDDELDIIATRNVSDAVPWDDV